MARKETSTPTDVDPEVENEMNAGASEDGSNLPAVQGSMELGAVQGEMGPDDIILPRLKITYGVGALAENFTPGDIVLADDNCLAHKEEDIDVIFLNVTQYWKEYLSNDDFKAGIRPRTFMSAAEVHNAGGSTKWINGVGPSFMRAMCLKMLIKKPDDLVCGLFGIPIDGAEYAVAVWDIDKSAYKSAGPVILSASQFSLRERGLLAGKFTMHTHMDKKKTGNIVPIPMIKLAGYNSDEVIAEIKAVFNGAPSE
jgi:hypothetical protein